MKTTRRARHVGGTGSFHVSPHAPSSPALPVFTDPEALNQVLLGFYGGITTQARLINPPATGDRFYLQPLAPCWRSGVGPKVPALLSHGLSPWQSAPFLSCYGVQKSPQLHNRRHLDHSSHLENSESFKSSVWEPGLRPNIYFLL